MPIDDPRDYILEISSGNLVDEFTWKMNQYLNICCISMSFCTLCIRFHGHPCMEIPISTTGYSPDVKAKERMGH